MDSKTMTFGDDAWGVLCEALMNLEIDADVWYWDMIADVSEWLTQTGRASWKYVTSYANGLTVWRDNQGEERLVMDGEVW